MPRNLVRPDAPGYAVFMQKARRHLWRAVRWPLFIAAVLVIGAGVPFAWVWVGSQLQGGTAPSMMGIGVALLGIAVSYGLLAWLLSWVKELLEPTSGPSRYAWNKSLSAERHQVGKTHPVEDMVITATVLVCVVCIVWFFFYGDPGIRPGT